MKDYTKALKIVEVLSTCGYESSSYEEIFEEIPRVTKYKITKDELLESLKDLGELVEREKPMKPIVVERGSSGDRFVSFGCPICGTYPFDNYCTVCGQRLE